MFVIFAVNVAALWSQYTYPTWSVLNPAKAKVPGSLATVFSIATAFVITGAVLPKVTLLVVNFIALSIRPPKFTPEITPSDFNIPEEGVTVNSPSNGADTILFIFTVRIWKLYVDSFGWIISIVAGITFPNIFQSFSLLSLVRNLTW